jgi:alanyl-tRNA synthetase
MSIDEASKLGAKMFFEDKYGDTVRVVKVWDEEESISMEFCWWTHVVNTKDIWAFTIVSQEAVASGVKRISAITGPKVLEKIQEIQWLLDSSVEKLWIKTATQISDRLDKVLKEYDELKSGYESMEAKIIISTLKNIESKNLDWFDKVLEISKELNFKNVSFHAKWLFENQNILIYNNEWNFIILSNWASAKELANKIWLKWWGNDNMVQGRDMKVLELLK